jgi:hypothetical protein
VVFPAHHSDGEAPVHAVFCADRGRPGPALYRLQEGEEDQTERGNAAGRLSLVREEAWRNTPAEKHGVLRITGMTHRLFAEYLPEASNFLWHAVRIAAQKCQIIFSLSYQYGRP